jgi:hypothetical protein
MPSAQLLRRWHCHLEGRVPAGFEHAFTGHCKAISFVERQANLVFLENFDSQRSFETYDMVYHLASHAFAMLRGVQKQTTDFGVGHGNETDRCSISF